MALHRCIADFSSFHEWWVAEQRRRLGWRASRFRSRGHASQSDGLVELRLHLALVIRKNCRKGGTLLALVSGLGWRPWRRLAIVATRPSSVGSRVPSERLPWQALRVCVAKRSSVERWNARAARVNVYVMYGPCRDKLRLQRIFYREAVPANA